MYTGVSTIPIAPKMASAGARSHAPSSVMNSPTKLLRPGSPSAAKATTAKTPAITGMRRASPAIPIRSRVPTRSSIHATIKKSAATMMPWLTIWTTAPCCPCALKAKIPSTTKPMWLTLEYETISFMSLCAIAISAPQMIAITASTATTQLQSHQPIGCGNKGTAMRRKPYAPALPITPAKVISIAVGAAMYASGSQLWKGKRGVLIANARPNTKNSQN